MSKIDRGNWLKRLNTGQRAAVAIGVLWILGVIAYASNEIFSDFDASSYYAYLWKGTFFEYDRQGDLFDRPLRVRWLALVAVAAAPSIAFAVLGLWVFGASERRRLGDADSAASTIVKTESDTHSSSLRKPGSENSFPSHELYPDRGFGGPAIHEPVERQREEAVSAIAPDFREAISPKFLGGLDCDQLPTGSGVFGSLDNPIPVNGSIGEIKYLAKLRGATGRALIFHRTASVHSPASANPVDRFEVVCLDGTQPTLLHFDCYHPRRSNLCPPGFTLEPFNPAVGADVGFGYGCNGMVNDFPHGVPEALIQFYGESLGLSLARVVEDSLAKHFRESN